MPALRDSIPPPGTLRPPAPPPPPPRQRHDPAERARQRARNRHWIGLSVLGILLAIIGFVAISVLRKVDEAGDVRDVVKTYIDARADGDAEKACAQLTSGQQRELVSRVSETPLSSAPPADCVTYVLKVSPNSQYTRANLSYFEDRDVRVELAKEENYARAVPEGLDGPNLWAWKRDGEWHLDGTSSIGAGFVAGCSDRGKSKSYCFCLFDELRDRNPHPAHLSRNATIPWLTEVLSGGGATQLQQAQAACQPKLSA